MAGSRMPPMRLTSFQPNLRRSPRRSTNSSPSESRSESAVRRRPVALRFSKLTRPAIRQLQPGEKLAEHGITVVRLANGDVRYAVGVMVDGQRIHRVIGLGSAGVTRTQCEEFIEAKRTDARAGRLALPRRRKLPLSFAAAAARYVERLDCGGGKNIRVKRRQLRMYLVPHFGSLRLNAVSEFAIDTYKKR